MLRSGLIVVLLAGTSCSVSNPLFTVDDDVVDTTTQGSGPNTTTQGGTSEPTSAPTSEPTSAPTSEPGTSTSSTTQTSEATTSEPEPVCGDAIEDRSEECDDGNDIDTDECVSGCVTAICGDGHVKMGHETCDDGNDIDNDECKNDCTLASCGDSITQLGEECDDGNGDDNDECTSLCLEPICGDGLPHDGEECDDGNLDDTDDCAACETATCGDGFVHMGEEECDDGNDGNDDACPNSCVAPYCGDGITQNNEICDDGQMNPLTCPDCTLTSVCGDGVISGEEECDYTAEPYKDVGTPLCLKNCKLLSCFVLENTPEEELKGQANNWLTPCTLGVAKTVVVTLLDQDNQVVYMAKGQISGDWMMNNLTAGGILPVSEYDVTSHMRRINLQRLMPKDAQTDVLMVTSQDATPGNDAQICYNRLGDGYGVAVFPKSLPPHKPKLLVMGTHGGMTGDQRFPKFDGSREVSYDEGGMNVCVDTTPFLGTFVMSVFP